MRPSSHLLSQKPWSEVIQAAAPRQPFVRRSRRLEIDVPVPALVSSSLKFLVPGPSAEPIPRNSTLTFWLKAAASANVPPHVVFGSKAAPLPPQLPVVKANGILPLCSEGSRTVLFAFNC